MEGKKTKGEEFPWIAAAVQGRFWICRRVLACLWPIRPGHNTVSVRQGRLLVDLHGHAMSA